MASDDLRDYLAVLEQRGLLRRVRETVDPEWEIGCLVKWAFQCLPEDERFGLFFESVAGSGIPAVTGALGASTEAYAIALGVEPEEINAKWERALRNPVPPTRIDDVPCQEVVHEGGAVDLSLLPIPVWTPGKDAGRYITTIVATSDAETGVQNHGVYRTLVTDRDRLICNLSLGRHPELLDEALVLVAQKDGDALGGARAVDVRRPHPHVVAGPEVRVPVVVAGALLGLVVVGDVRAGQEPPDLLVDGEELRIAAFERVAHRVVVGVDGLDGEDSPDPSLAPHKGAGGVLEQPENRITPSAVVEERGGVGYLSRQIQHPGRDRRPVEAGAVPAESAGRSPHSWVTQCIRLAADVEVEHGTLRIRQIVPDKGETSGVSSVGRRYTYLINKFPSVEFVIIVVQRADGEASNVDISICNRVPAAFHRPHRHCPGPDLLVAQGHVEGGAGALRLSRHGPGKGEQQPS